MKKEFFVCDYCGAVLKTTRGYKNHECAKKTLAKETSDISMARAKWLFDFWIKYNGYGKNRTQKEFERAPHFEAFVRFVHHIETVYLPAPAMEFIKWVSDENIAMAKWTDDSTIQRFKRAYERGDNAVEATTACLEQMATWCDNNSIELEEFFDTISPAEMIKWLQSGRMSPWVFILTPLSVPFVQRCDDDQIEFISNLLDFDYWENRLNVSTGTAEKVLSILRELDLA